MNSFFSFVLIFCLIFSATIPTFAQSLVANTLTQPDKPIFKPKVEEKKVIVPEKKAINIKVPKKSYNTLEIVKSYPVLKKRIVKTNSSDKYIKSFVNSVDKYWIPPVTDKDIIIVYDVTVSRNKIVKSDITFSNTTKEMESLADEAIKKAEVYLKNQRKIFRKTTSFKIYFTQNIKTVSAANKKISDIQPTPILSGPLPNLKPVQFSEPKFAIKSDSNFTKPLMSQLPTVTYEPNIIANIYEYDSTIDMNYVQPSVTVHRAYDVQQNKECYFCRNLENILVSNWVPVQDNISRNVIFRVDIDSNNSLKYTMQSSSSDPSVDKAALLSLYNTKLSGLYGYYNSGTYVVTYHSGPPEKPDFDTYLRNLRRQLKDSWKPYSQTITTPVEIIIAISDKGDIFSWNILKSSGSKKQDDSVINSILLSIPVKELPEKYRGEYVKVKLTYQMNKIFNVINVSNEPSGITEDITTTKNPNAKMPDFGPYMRDIQRRVKMNWDPPKGNQSKRVVLLFRIAKDGRLLSCSVSKSSGLPNVDKAALTAVHLAVPFRPLPSEFNGDFIDIQFTFDYNVYGATKYPNMF